MKTDVKKTAYEALYKIFGDSLSYFYPEDFKSLPRVSYYEIYARPAIWADDRQYMEEAEIMVDLWSREIAGLDAMGVSTDKAMENAGFTKKNAVEMFDGGVYHRAQRYKMVIGVD